MRFEVRNEGTEAITLYLRGRAPILDVEVTDAGGDVVWSRLAGQVVPAILQMVPLAPGARLTARARWRARVPPGVYGVRAGLLTDAEPLRAPPARLVVTAPGTVDS